MGDLSSSPLTYDDGVHLPGTVLWFEAARERDLCFLGRARARRMPRHKKILCTHATARLLQHDTQPLNALVSPYGRPFTLGPLKLELFPSGVALGAAGLRVETDTHRIVYISELRPEGGPTSELPQVRAADVVAIHCPYGNPELRFPARAEVEEDILDWVQNTIKRGRVPVLLTERLGKAQDLLKLLTDAGIRTRTHRSIYETSAVYRECGVVLEKYRRFVATPEDHEALIWPLHLRHSPAIRRIRRTQRFAVFSGRAVHEQDDLLSAHRAHRAFPYSLQSDAAGLLAFVEATGAKQVVLAGGDTIPFEAALKHRGLTVEVIHPPEQLPLV